MKLAIISFAREGSKRLPKKNTMLLNGKPLIWYTLQTMEYIYKNYLVYQNILIGSKTPHCMCAFLLEGEKLIKYCYKNGYPYIIRDHPKEWDDNRLNQWIHEKLNMDAYLLLQPTSPFRDNKKITKWLELCVDNNIQSAYAIKQIDKIFIRAGSFFYYTKEQLATGKLNDENSLVFIDNNDIDIDTIEDFKKAERLIKKYAK